MRCIYDSVPSFINCTAITIGGILIWAISSFILMMLVLLVLGHFKRGEK